MKIAMTIICACGAALSVAGGRWDAAAWALCAWSWAMRALTLESKIN